MVILAAGSLIFGSTIGYMIGQKSANTQLKDLIHSMAVIHSAKETVFYTRLLEGLRDGKTDLVTDRLETMLDSSIVHIGIETEFSGASKDVDEAVNRSLCVARNYRELHPHRPSHDWAAKYYDAALKANGK
jgi:hypothetical protein